MGDAYFQGSSVPKGDAGNFGASWTRDELAMLRDLWRHIDLADLARRLGRTEAACHAQHHYQQSRPEAERWEPAQRVVRAVEREHEAKRAQRPVNTIHEDEERWWEAGHYLTG